jgi:DNA primase
VTAGAGDEVVTVTHADRVLFPASGHTKGDVVAHTAAPQRACLVLESFDRFRS